MYAPLFIYHHLDSLAYVRPSPRASLSLALVLYLSLSLYLAHGSSSTRQAHPPEMCTVGSWVFAEHV